MGNDNGEGGGLPAGVVRSGAQVALLLVLESMKVDAGRNLTQVQLPWHIRENDGLLFFIRVLLLGLHCFVFAGDDTTQPWNPARSFDGNRILLYSMIVHMISDFERTRVSGHGRLDHSVLHLVRKLRVLTLRSEVELGKMGGQGIFSRVFEKKILQGHFLVGEECLGSE